MKLSLCLTTFNRTTLLQRSFEAVLCDDQITEIVIVDDCSTEPKVAPFLDTLAMLPKVTIVRNDSNLGMSRNKAKAISLAHTSHAIIFDSDNLLTPAYLDALEHHFGEGLEQVIYMPSGALPHFDYSRYANMTITRETARQHIDDRTFLRMLNTCNYVVPVAEYGRVYRFNPEVKGSDTLWFNYLWLKAGHPFVVVPDMTYPHLVHDGSGWKADRSHNRKMADHTRELIRGL